MNKTVIAAAFVAFTGSAYGADLAGVSLPDTVELGGEELVLNGMGLREKFWVDVYVGALYLPQPADSAETAINMEGPSRVVMHFVHDAPAEKVIDGWKEGFTNNNEKAVIDALGEQIATFNGYFDKDIKDGEAVVLDYLPGKGTTVTINGEVKGTIPGADFNRALRAVWLGPKPPSKNFRKGLLGG